MTPIAKTKKKKTNATKDAGASGAGGATAATATITTPTGKKLLRCEDCDKTYASRSGYQYHLLSHHPEKVHKNWTPAAGAGAAGGGDVTKTKPADNEQKEGKNDSTTDDVSGDVDQTMSAEGAGDAGKKTRKKRKKVRFSSVDYQLGLKQKQFLKLLFD